MYQILYTRYTYTATGRHWIDLLAQNGQNTRNYKKTQAIQSLANILVK